MKKETTTITISVELRDALKSLGNKGETYDEIIRRTLNLQETCDACLFETEDFLKNQHPEVWEELKEKRRNEPNGS